MVTARRDLDAISRDLAGEQGRAAKAAATLAEAGGRRDSLAAELTAIRSRGQVLNREQFTIPDLTPAKLRAEQLVDLLPRRDRVEKKLADQAAGLISARARLAEAEADVPRLEARLAEVRGHVEEARAEREALQRRHSAAELRRHLEPGAPCPVCEQAVRSVPKSGAVGLGEADAAVKKAEAGEAEARGLLERGRVGLERAGCAAP